MGSLWNEKIACIVFADCVFSEKLKMDQYIAGQGAVFEGKSQRACLFVLVCARARLRWLFV